MQTAKRIREVLKVNTRDGSLGSDALQESNFYKAQKTALKFTRSEGLAGIQAREIRIQPK